MVEEVDNDDDIVEVEATEIYSRRVGKEPMNQHPSEDKDVVDSSDSGGGDGEGSGLEDEDVVNPEEREFVEDSSDSWDAFDEDLIEPGTTNRTSAAKKVTFYHICQVNV